MSQWRQQMVREKHNKPLWVQVAVMNHGSLHSSLVCNDGNRMINLATCIQPNGANDNIKWQMKTFNCSLSVRQHSTLQRKQVGRMRVWSQAMAGGVKPQKRPTADVPWGCEGVCVCLCAQLCLCVEDKMIKKKEEERYWPNSQCPHNYRRTMQVKSLGLSDAATVDKRTDEQKRKEQEWQFEKKNNSQKINIENRGRKRAWVSRRDTIISKLLITLFSQKCLHLWGSLMEGGRGIHGNVFL